MNISGLFIKRPIMTSLVMLAVMIFGLFAYRLLPVNGLPMLQNVTSDLQIKNPQVNLDIDRDRAAALGVTAQQIEDTLYSAYGSRQVSTIYSPTNQYQVIMELEPRHQLDPASLGLLYVRSGGGQLVPLSSLGTLKNDLGPLSVNHPGQITAVTISFNLKPDVPLGPRPCRGRRPPGVAAPDTLHHAGDLLLYGPDSGIGTASPWKTEGSAK